jgi:hypothetical protein
MFCGALDAMQSKEMQFFEDNNFEMIGGSSKKGT